MIRLRVLISCDHEECTKTIRASAKLEIIGYLPRPHFISVYMDHDWNEVPSEELPPTPKWVFYENKQQAFCPEHAPK